MCTHDDDRACVAVPGDAFFVPGGHVFFAALDQPKEQELRKTKRDEEPPHRSHNTALTTPHTHIEVD